MRLHSTVGFERYRKQNTITNPQLLRAQKHQKRRLISRMRRLRETNNMIKKLICLLLGHRLNLDDKQYYPSGPVWSWRNRPHAFCVRCNKYIGL